MAAADLRDLTHADVWDLGHRPGDTQPNPVSDAESLLTLHPERIRELIEANLSVLPRWADDLMGLINFLKECITERAPAPFQARAREDRFIFLPLCIPVVRFASHSLKQSCARRFHEQLSAHAHHELRSALAARLLRGIRPVAQADLRAFEIAQEQRSGLNIPRIPRETAHFFLPSPEVRLLHLFREYPALARLMSELAVDWVDSTRELFERVYRDRRALLRVFGKSLRLDGSKTALVRDVQPALGDPHRHGRSVIALSLRGGGRVVYKPRDCRGEWEWRRLSQQLADVSLRPRAPKVIQRKGWAWVEFVTAGPCQSDAAARRFYRRAGAVLCMAHLLRAEDLHRGNVIAAGAHPVVIDLETLWSSEANSFENAPLVLTSLLPAAGVAANADWSGFGSPPTEERDRATHLPRLAGVPLRAADFLSEVEDGFCHVAVSLLSSAGSRNRLTRQRKRIAHTRWRKVFWSTEAYAMMQESSVKPNLLKDGITRFFAIAGDCTARGATSDIAFQEAAALMRLDIPYFTTCAKVVGRAPIRPVRLCEILRKLPEIRAAFLAATVSSGLSHGQFDTAPAAPPYPSDT